MRHLYVPKFCAVLLAGAFVVCCSHRAAPPENARDCPGPADAAAAEPWPASVRTREELHRLGFFHPGIVWKDFEHNGMQLAIAVETWPTDGESYIDVYGYVFNRHFQEWRRFVGVQIRGAGGLEVRVDAATGMLTAAGTANNDMRGKALLTYDLRAVYDDR